MRGTSWEVMARRRGEWRAQPGRSPGLQQAARVRVFETWCTEGPWSPSVSTASADSASPSSSPSSETPGGLEPERGSAAARWKKYGQKKSFQETKRNPILGFQEISSRNRRNPNLRFPGPPMVTAAVAWRTLALGHSARAPTLKSQPLAQLSPTPATFCGLPKPIRFRGSCSRVPHVCPFLGP